ncbi:DNA-binding transcriptional regulator [Parelusimicrobium proximum]|uniref:MarR family winged helix-turn-helix transcriptional regulator n=1 Tax=Parelusimicrobium proximum TaxID=3228953 RepID=UPI003D17E43F
MTEKEFTLMEKFTRVLMLMHRAHHHNHMHQDGAFSNIHRGQGRVLALLKMKPNISQKELGYLLDLRAQSLSELLAKLEKNGFIQRAESEEDKRAMNISLTPKGEEAASKGEESGREDLFFFLTEKDKETLSAVLDKIIEGFKERTTEGEEYDRPRHHFSHFHGAHGPFGRGGRRGRGEEPFDCGHTPGEEGGREEAMKHFKDRNHRRRR